MAAERQVPTDQPAADALENNPQNAAPSWNSSYKPPATPANSYANKAPTFGGSAPSSRQNPQLISGMRSLVSSLSQLVKQLKAKAQ
jgi:hypothetical protein